MMRLHKVVPERIDYYLGITASEAKTAFYERDGYWLGGLATHFGLSDSVQREMLGLLVHGRHPIDGNQLNRYQHRTRYWAIDATFAAPKTISVLAALGEPEITGRVVLAHREAAAETLQFIEREVLTVRKIRGGVRRQLKPDGICVAAFEHRTSRASDPHLHSHALILNLATPDRSYWSALDSRALFVHSSLLGALYRASLRRHMSDRLELTWREIKPGWFDLGGLSTTMVHTFSKRRQLILADMQKTNHVGVRAGEVANLRTRVERETSTSYGEICERWRETGYRSGISKGRLLELAHVRERAEVGIDDVTRTVVDVAREKQTPLTRAQLLRTVADRLPNGVRIRDLERSVVDAVEKGNIQPPTALWPDGPRGVSCPIVEMSRQRVRERGDPYDDRPRRHRSRSSERDLVYAR